MEICELQRSETPMWVRRLMDRPDASRRWQVSGLRASSVERGAFSLTEIVLPNARAMSPDVFRGEVQRAYELALETLSACRASHAVRWWNFVPGINRDAGDGLDWYMVFNAGRHAAMQRRYGANEFGRQLATASGVGSHGDDFVVQVLGSTRPGQPLENPRQIPAYNYSESYGPLPPCFARATGLGHAEHDAMRGTLLIGGTASIVGEKTQHLGNIDGQMEETLRNMAHLLAAGCGAAAEDRVLRHIEEVRVYVVRQEDRAGIIDALAARMTGLKRMEVIHADLCRPCLLVEVEAVTGPGLLASMNQRGAAGQRLATA
ncbi:hypothetical protein ACERK3_05140 [Phycisphaerales bacterium AB-hyl4]|uniref:Chorismatase FkbO/Hyg5-like N-terminal domain-containing protein n=1 Tax=Natronomicrosphaera hydrolytica TaxID=3242702 RepID=A0ABV4U247_9BACT